MKKTFSISIFFFVFSLSAQAPPPKVEELKEYYNSSFKKSPLLTYYYKDVNNYFAPFIGTWIYQNGNQTFVLRLWKVAQKPVYPDDPPKAYVDELRGHYKLVQNYGSANEQTIYTSEINIGNSSTPWPTIIMGNSPIRPYEMSGQIYDISQPFSQARPLGIEGEFKMNINQSNFNTTTWRIKLPMGIYGTNQSTTFNIPTNITLTKVN
ncbi:DUF6705 family protein [Flavobacterium sp.]|uniref:DUF6705 family protein n=1 Tax=Flavobacterium sp. TaxID=239 RepID=UPI0026167437|nr:DUF6705 family protein [Flavobacterium sp.]